MTKEITTFNLDLEDIKKLDIISSILKKSRSRIVSELIKEMPIDEADQKIKQIQMEIREIQKSSQS